MEVKRETREGAEMLLRGYRERERGQTIETRSKQVDRHRHTNR